MSNSIEWAHIDSGSETTTAALLHQADPEDRRLDPEMGPWSAAIFAGDGVAIYADSPQDLIKWLERRIKDLRGIVERSEGSIYLVSASGGIEQPSFQSFTDESMALWRYLDLVRDLVPGEYGDRVDLLRIEGDRTEVIASTTSSGEDGDE